MDDDHRSIVKDIIQKQRKQDSGSYKIVHFDNETGTDVTRVLTDGEVALVKQYLKQHERFIPREEICKKINGKKTCLTIRGEDMYIDDGHILFEKDGTSSFSDKKKKKFLNLKISNFFKLLEIIKEF